ncbi:MAG: carotenoid biosynthesis protein [Acidobacteria bacterium]|nr:carotenoid biosynthesis protein [Acidobacteriota bacterium]
MLRFVELLIGTLTLRPYVFIFLLCYLFLAVTHIGYRRTLLFTVIAYTVAFLCEWSSAVAGTGFPFGLYRYIDATSDRELWIAGVPWMDSLSFTFLSYVSWEVAVLCRSRVKSGWSDVRVEQSPRIRNSWGTTLLASLLMTYLDIIIDPVTLLGDRWFLGRIYYYPDGGAYFGVTLANFAGWFFVCFAILRLYVLLERFIFRSPPKPHRGIAEYRYKALGAPALYFGILAFNLFITFWIGELLIGLVGVFITTPLLLLVGFSIGQRRITEQTD